MSSSSSSIPQRSRFRCFFSLASRALETRRDGPEIGQDSMYEYPTCTLKSLTDALDTDRISLFRLVHNRQGDRAKSIGAGEKRLRRAEVDHLPTGSTCHFGHPPTTRDLVDHGPKWNHQLHPAQLLRANQSVPVMPSNS